MNYFSLEPCTNCRQNQWRLGVRDARTGKTEFSCFDCANTVYVLLARDEYRHLAGGD